VPVWDAAGGQSAKMRHHIARFAQAPISAHQVNGRSRIAVVAQGAAICSG
jgi:hypothetical protein